MNAIFQYIRQADQLFWGQSFYQIWFYIAIFLIIIFEKSPITKRTIGIYPLCFILALYNPVAYNLVQKYTSGGIGYFARLFSMIPLPIILGLGTVLFTDRISSIRVKPITDSNDLKEKESGHNQIRIAVKMILFSCCCGIMLILGPIVYKETWFQSAQNYEKVPADIINLCNTLHRDEGVTIAGPGLPSRYIRQIDSSFYMPYGRLLNDLGNALSQEEPDPEYVMIEAGKQGCDYIIVDNNEINLIDFNSFGWEPCFVQGNYQVYKVEGVRHTVNQYNSFRQLVKQTTLDEENNPTENEQGYCYRIIEYDFKGKILRESFYDTEERLIGQTGQGADRQFDLLKYHYSTSGVGEDASGVIEFNTDTADNRFSMIHFQLYTADQKEYILSFGSGNSRGVFSGSYDHQMPEGLYYLRMKANSNLNDEYIECLVYLKPDDKLVYRYVIDEIEADHITISGLSVSFIQ